MNIEEEIQNIQREVDEIGAEAKTEPIQPAKPARKRNPLVLAAVAILALGAVYKGYGAYSFGQSHVDTDDAYVTGDLVGISPSVAGNLVELKVQDGDFVKKGQLIALIDPSGPQAELSQAEANLKAVQTQVPQAVAAFNYAKLATDASIRKSLAELSTQSAHTAGSRLQVDLSRDTVRNQIAQAQSQLLASRAQADQAEAGVESARSAYANAQQAVETADRSRDAATAMIDSAKADADRTAKDLERYRQLLNSDAISQQQFDVASSAAASAKANLTSSQQKAEAAKSQAAQARESVRQALAQLNVSLKQADAAGKQVQVASAGVGLAKASRTNVGIFDTGVQSSQGQEGQDVADLANSKAGLEQVTLRQTQIATAQAQVAQAEAAVDQAKIHLRDCTLIAPCDGFVVKHTVNVGSALNPGQTIVTMTRGSDVWVMANFKETQLKGVAPGQPVTVEVDAYPGKEFKGHVQSVLRATGSATTLLPPDNSTGNFTKIVQRVPVRIALDGDKTDKDLLRQGMSVIATIDVAGKRGE